MSLEHVFQPFAIRGVELRNRIVRTAHNTLIGGGLVSDDLIAYHEARARGGVALSILEVGLVHPSAPVGTRLYDDAVLEGYRKLVPAVHSHGMKIFQQLWHPGHHVMNIDGGPPLSASDIPSPQLGQVPRPMSLSMIDEMVACYAAAAKRVQAGGLDGVEIHFAHSYLIGQFLSPLTNRRDDRYGGSLENRLRFGVEVLTAVRDAVGKDYPVGVRLSADEGVVGGLRTNDTRRVATLLEATGLVDFFDLSTASYFTLDHMVAGMHEPHGYQLPESEAVTRAVSAPTIAVGRIKTLEEADRIIGSGAADLVSMVRATIADPDLVVKTQQGRTEEVRPCIGCNQACLGGWTGPLMRFGCAVNPGTGQERRFGDHALARAERPKRVMVVGGGPAGMEAARVAALRGHEVTLYEAAPALGGQTRLARQTPYRAEFGEIADWLERELRRLEVKILTGSSVNRNLVEQEAPDAVIVATGSSPRRGGEQVARPGEAAKGADLPHVLTSHDLMSGAAKPGKSAVVVDDVGHYEAVAVAEYLQSVGAAVTFVTRHTTVAPLLVNALMQGPALGRLNRHQSGFRLVPRSIVVEITQTAARIRDFDSGVEQEVPADTVVFVTHNRANRSLVDELEGYPGQVIAVGDAVAPRPLEMAIHEGHYAATRL